MYRSRSRPPLNIRFGHGGIGLSRNMFWADRVPEVPDNSQSGFRACHVYALGVQWSLKGVAQESHRCWLRGGSRVETGRHMGDCVSSVDCQHMGELCKPVRD